METVSPIQFHRDPGIDFNVECNINQNVVYPEISGYSTFLGKNPNEITIQSWCRVPEDIQDSQVTINVEAINLERWCGLTSTSIRVHKYIDQGNGSSAFIGGMDAHINLTPNPMPICPREFFEVHYAIRYDESFEYIELQTYTLRGYGYDDTTPIYVDNYHRFPTGSVDQLTNGWGSENETGTIASHFKNWKNVLEQENESLQQFGEPLYIFGSQTITKTVGMNPDEARRAIYKSLCSAVRAQANIVWSDGISNGLSGVIGITYPSIDNNVSDDVIDLGTIFLYMYDETCDPYD